MDTTVFTMFSLLGSLAMGGIIGGIAATIACRNAQPVFAVIGFIGCMYITLLGGLLLGLPSLLFFALFSWLQGRSEGSVSPSVSASRDTSGGGRRWVVISMFLGIFLLAVVGLFGFAMALKKTPEESYLTAAKRIVNGLDLNSEGKSVISKGEMREFRSLDGRIIKAQIMSFDGEIVEIVREDGRLFRSSISSYSKEDQKYIRSFN